MTPWWYYVVGTPLGVLGLVRWSFWLVRRIPAVLYAPFVGDFSSPISVVVPVYQEDPEIFTTALESWLANAVDQVILVVDVTDTVCLDIARRYAVDHPVTVIATDVPGKRDALRRGWNAASTELVALVDSDTIWAANVAAEVCKPFADPRIGGVGTRQSVYQGSGLLSRVNDMFLDHRYYDENACQTYMGRAVSCLSGRTAIYRRALLLGIEHEFMNETFWGVQCLSGDDKRLTTLILRLGYQTYLQRTARVWSTFPTRWREFVSQRLRWARNTWRSDLRALSQPWVWRHPFLAYTISDKAISCFTLLVGPVFMAYSLLQHHWLFAGVLALWWQVSRSAKLLPHLRQRPSSFFVIPGYVVLSWVMALIKIRALLTIRKQHWLTRDVAVEGGTVVRTVAVGVGDTGNPPSARPWLPQAVAVVTLLVCGAVLCHPIPRPAIMEPVATVADSDPLPNDPGTPDSGADAETGDPTPPAEDTGSPPTTDTAPTSEPTSEPTSAEIQAANRARHERALAAHRAGLAATRQRHAAAAAASIAALWQLRGRPDQLAIVRAHNVDLVSAGHLVRRVPRPGGTALTLRDLSRLLPPDWLAITNDGTARLFATLVLGAGTTLDTGPDVHSLRLAGGASPAKAASLRVGHARLSIHNLDVGSFDRDAGGDQPPAATAPGRPFIVAGAGSVLDIAEATLHDLGASAEAEPGPTAAAAAGPGAHAAVVYGPGSTGSITRAELHANSVGIQLAASHDVHLDAVTVADSSRDGLMLHGDVGTTLRGVHAVRNGRNGVTVTGPSTDRTITGITTRGNERFGVAVIGQQHPTLADVTTDKDRAGGVRLTNTTGATVANVTLNDEPVGILINGANNNGTRVLGGHIVRGHDGIVVARGTRAVTLTNPDIIGVDHDGISTAGVETRISGGSITEGRTGIHVRAPAHVAGTSISGVTQGVHVGPNGALTADGMDVLATGSGLKVDAAATATLTDSRIRARRSLRGAVTLLGVKNTISPAPFNWIGAFGALFVALAVGLEATAAIRHRRRRQTTSAASPAFPDPHHIQHYQAINESLQPVSSPQ